MRKMLNLKINSYYEIYTNPQQSPDRVVCIIEVKGKTICSSKSHRYFVTWPQKELQNPCCRYIWDAGVANMLLSHHYDLYVYNPVIRGCREVTKADFVRQHRELSPGEIESFRRELIYDIERRKCIGCASSSFCHKQPSYEEINKDIKYCPCVTCVVKMVCVTSCMEYHAYLESYPNHLREITDGVI